MKYNNEQRELQSKLNKMKIINAGKELVIEKGYNNISVSEITSKAGISKGAFYIHYKTKDDLIPDLINLTFEEYKNPSQSKSPLQEIKDYLIKSTKEIMKEGLITAQTWFSESVKGSLYGNKKLIYDEEYLKSVLTRIKDDGNATIIVKKITSFYYGVLIKWCITNGKENPLELLNNYLENELTMLLK